MLTVHIFGKGEGCSKCAALKHKAALVITEEPFRGQFEVQFHDLLTEEGIAEFCRTNINPNCVPGLVVGVGPRKVIWRHFAFRTQFRYHDDEAEFERRGTPLDSCRTPHAVRTKHLSHRDRRGAGGYWSW